jgi:hypothetical protein
VFYAGGSGIALYEGQTGICGHSPWQSNIGQCKIDSLQQKRHYLEKDIQCNRISNLLEKERQVAANRHGKLQCE